MTCMQMGQLRFVCSSRPVVGPVEQVYYLWLGHRLSSENQMNPLGPRHWQSAELPPRRYGGRAGSSEAWLKYRANLPHDPFLGGQDEHVAGREGRSVDAAAERSTTCVRHQRSGGVDPSRWAHYLNPVKINKWANSFPEPKITTTKRASSNAPRTPTR